MLEILLNSQTNPLQPVITIIGFAIAMIWLFLRWDKKDNPDSEENKNKMQ